MVVFFDEAHARSIGLRPGLLKAVFFVLLSACVVAAMQTVGAFLVIAMVVTPGATAYLLCDRFPRLIAALRRHRHGHELRRRLRELLPRRRHRRHHRLPADAALPRRLRPRPPPRPPRRPRPRRRGPARGRAMIETLLLPFQFPFMLQAFLIAAIVAIPTGAPLLLSRPQGLGADGRRGQPCRPARHRPRLHLRLPADPRRLRRRHGDGARHRLPRRQQPGQAGHGDGRGLLRHVRPRDRALHLDHHRRAPRPRPLRQHPRRQHRRHLDRRPDLPRRDRRRSCSSGRT